MIFVYPLRTSLKLAFLSLIVTSGVGLAVQNDTGDVTPVTASGNASRDTDLLGPGDQLSIWILGLPEISDKPTQVSEKGQVDLPVLGVLKASGITLGQFRTELIEKAREYVRTPQVSVTLSESKSRPVTVVGAVNTPGFHQLQGQKTLIEVLSVAGGLRSDAGNTIKITRKAEWGPLPVAGATEDKDAGVSVAEVRVHDLLEAKTPKNNIGIRPYDVITVPRADLVYVVGEVQKAGGFPLNERETITALQALALAGGLAATAAPSATRILREVPGDPSRQEMPVDLRKLLGGKRVDVPLRAGDILFIPNSTAKTAGKRALETAIQLGIGLAVFRR
jgi:polysaccharide export outer membrane protein